LSAIRSHPFQYPLPVLLLLRTGTAENDQYHYLPITSRALFFVLDAERLKIEFPAEAARNQENTAVGIAIPGAREPRSIFILGDDQGIMKTTLLPVSLTAVSLT
jgi:hypothetical protein